MTLAEYCQPRGMRGQLAQKTEICPEQIDTIKRGGFCSLRNALKIWRGTSGEVLPTSLGLSKDDLALLVDYKGE